MVLRHSPSCRGITTKRKRSNMADFSATVDPKDYMRIMNMLSDLSKFERDAVIAKGIQEGLKIVVQEGKSNLAASGTKVRKGNLSGSFKVLTKKKDLKGYAGFSRPKGSAAHLIDRGTAVRHTSKGANRGKVTGNLFWTKAVEGKSGKAMQELYDSIEKSIKMIQNRNR